MTININGISYPAYVKANNIFQGELTIYWNDSNMTSSNYFLKYYADQNRELLTCLLSTYPEYFI